MSSFDIESIVYRMENSAMMFSIGQEIQLAGSCWLSLRKLIGDSALRDSLDVPDGTRKIFMEGKATLAQLQALEAEVAQLLVEIDQGLKRSFRKLAEARIKFPS
jgi:hypothetical protein